ncbi:NAD-dependent epimerase/dehydratase family protein [Rossellomorea aquimaris]|uniref:NAD(P)-dependent oxidoreductase n=1 Tax=Rossellomorea aquimaris TaxID=189382 RepID=A0A5D4TL95_9BACI|nr:NAD(P)-dependent oxidoreductase [Rossellomorea aquimaris]TYS75739.1 NAD(P)-dependent oxidoreductase [Rossellomorea aquimaris]
MVRSRKRIFLLGASGVIGDIILEGLSSKYDFILADIERKRSDSTFPYLQVDASSYKDLYKSVPKDTDIIINLVALPEMPEVVDIETMDQMTDVYLKASYNTLTIARELNIKKVIFASSNHVTDVYENEGNSLLENEITSEDYPYSRGVYGVLKLASENLGYVFHHHYGMSIVNLRIGTVKKNEKEAVKRDQRITKTLLSSVDAVELFEKTIESSVAFGTYYGVSDNPGKPWSIENAEKEIHYQSKVNTSHILQD